MASLSRRFLQYSPLTCLASCVGMLTLTACGESPGSVFNNTAGNSSQLTDGGLAGTSGVNGQGNGGDGGNGTANAGNGNGTGGDAPNGGGTGGSGGSGPITTMPGADGSVPITPTCELGMLPMDEPCLVSDEFAVFVDPLGTGSGTQADPTADINAAIAAAIADEKPFVLICEGDITTPLALTEDHAGLTIIGGFDCNGWSYDEEEHPTVVAPTDPGPALTIDGIDGQLTLHSIGFQAADATDPSTSSIAVIINDSDHVTFQNVTITAGNGTDGAEGSLTPYEVGVGEWPSAEEQRGKDAVGSTRGGQTKVTCPDANSSTGALGGDGVADGNPGNGSDGTPTVPGDPRGFGGTYFNDECHAGGRGADAPAADDGIGAPTSGTLTGTTWTPTDGTAGGDGTPGQGGGGGSGGVHPTLGGGGGGAAGGCGGKGALPGTGGGASFALLVVNSAVSIAGSTIVGGNGGDGGDGVAGQDGQAGGVPGSQTDFGCPGGGGGTGGNGGASGGGAGGVSAGIAYRGTAPMLTSSIVTPGTAGTGGNGGNDASSDDDGVTPTAVELLAL